jgi:5-methylcytosine-specific restriction endonuclease McrA
MTKKEEREYFYKMFDGKCAYCGFPLNPRWHIDHVEPIERYKKFNYDKKKMETIVYRPERDALENKLPSCSNCNLWKHSFSLETFRTEIQKQVERARKYSRNFMMAERYGLIKETGDKVVFYFEKHKATSA